MRSLCFIGLIVYAAIANCQPAEVLSAQKISKLLPSRLEGLKLKGVSKSSEMKIGTLKYSLCERNFSSGNKQIRILLFDYVDAPIMYQQVMRNYSNITPVESDSLTFRPVDMVGVSGWESVNVAAHEAKLVLGIYERYFLTITGENVDLREVTKVFQQIDLKKFPK